MDTRNFILNNRILSPLIESTVRRYFNETSDSSEVQVKEVHTLRNRTPSGPLGFNSPNIAQRHALHVERTAKKAFMLSDRV